MPRADCAVTGGGGGSPQPRRARRWQVSRWWCSAGSRGIASHPAAGLALPSFPSLSSFGTARAVRVPAGERGAGGPGPGPGGGERSVRRWSRGAASADNGPDRFRCPCAAAACPRKHGRLPAAGAGSRPRWHRAFPAACPAECDARAGVHVRAGMPQAPFCLWVECSVCSPSGFASGAVSIAPCA